MSRSFTRRIAGPVTVLAALAAGAGTLAEGLGSGTSQASQQLRNPLDGDPLMDSRPGGRREFYFTRAIYSGHGRGWGWRGGGSWRVDYPKADRQFVYGLRRLTYIDAYESDNAIRLDDPELSRYPFLYALEVGYMNMTDIEAEGLRRYLMAGGFLFIDDFWGSWEWRNFEREIARVLPEFPIVDVPLEHPIFHTLYDIAKIEQVPNVGIIRGGPTWEQDGYVPYVRGIFDDEGRLLVLINWNTDLGDAWEWVDNPYYPLVYSNFAYQLAVNTILYVMSH